MYLEETSSVSGHSRSTMTVRWIEAYNQNFLTWNSDLTCFRTSTPRLVKHGMGALCTVLAAMVLHMPGGSSQ